MTGPVLEILDPGVRTTVQDHPGRIGLQAKGIFPSGPVDHLAFRAANVLAGNAAGAAALEIPMGRFAARAHLRGRVAVCGAEGAGVTINGAPVPMWEALDVRAGDVLAAGTLKGPGFRLYLAVSGGIDVPVVLGSRALHTGAGFGGLDGRALVRGDAVPVGTPAAVRDSPRLRLPQGLRPAYHRHWEIEVMRGPHADPGYLTSADWRGFATSRWRVNLNSDRLYVRLNPHDFAWTRPDGGVAGAHPSNVLDGGYPVGGIIVNGDLPTILGPDGATSGGFTVIATIVHAALWKVGQLRPGQDTVRFREVDLDQADALARHTEFVLEPSNMERLCA